MTTAAYPATLDLNAVVPSRPDQLGLLRTIVRSYGSEFDVSIERLDDLALAVTEASAFLMEHTHPDAVSVGLGETDGSLAISVIGHHANNSDWPDPAWDGSMAGHVLAALTDSLELVTEDDGPAFHMTVRL